MTVYVIQQRINMNEVSTSQQFSKGLEGVVAAQTRLGYVDGEKGQLVYRNYEINTLVQNSNYEETTYLLLKGKLPNRHEYEEFVKKLRERMTITDELYDIIRDMGANCHSMSALRTAVSYVGSTSDLGDRESIDSQEEMGIDVIAKMPTIVSAIYRARNNLEFIKPDPKLSYTGNFMYQSFGKKPTDENLRILDSLLLLHADHGMNASTFTSMVVISTLSDIYSAVTAAISALKGPLHGGANERALEMIRRVGSPDKVQETISTMLEKKEKIMGFGHRVYKVYDPRARIVKAYADKLTQGTKLRPVFETADRIEEFMVDRLGSKGIFPNVDFYSGIVYNALGFEPDIFTPIFAVSRVAGWVARDLEYLGDNRIFRPKALFAGEKVLKDYPPMETR